MDQACGLKTKRSRELRAKMTSYVASASAEELEMLNKLVSVKHE